MRALALALCVIAAGCTADLALGDPEVSAVCLDDATLVFGGGADRATIDLGPLDLEAPEDRRVTLASATMTASSGVSDLGFAERVQVLLLDTDDGDLALADAAVSGGVVELDGDPGVDLGAYLRAGASRIEVAIAGQMPSGRWAAVVDLCFDVD